MNSLTAASRRVTHTHMVPKIGPRRSKNRRMRKHQQTRAQQPKQPTWKWVWDWALKLGNLVILAYRLWQLIHRALLTRSP
jgi:hypothetical protein